MNKKNKTITDTIDSNSLNSTNNYFEIITMFFLFSILIIDFFPLFGSVEIIAPQFFYLSIINIITSIFIYKNPDLLSNSIVTVLKNSWVIKSYITFLILCGITTITAINFSLAIVSFMQLSIVFCLFINLSVLLHNRLSIIYNITLLIGIDVFIRSYIDLIQFIDIAKSSNFLNALKLLKGNTGNYNIFAASLTGKIPFLLLGIVHFSRWKRWFLSLSLFLASLLVLLIASRSSYIALFLIVISFIAIILTIKNDKKLIKTLLTNIIFPIIIGFFIANFVFKKSGNTTRFSSVTDRITQITSVQTADASVNVRLKYWENAFEIAKKNPVFGIGLGNWKIESIPYEKEISNDLKISNHAHNDFLEITAETGFLNLIVYSLIFIFALVANIKNCSAKKEYQTRIIALVALLLMISYGIDALFNFPLYRTTMQINFCLFLALTVLNTNLNEIVNDIKWNKNIILGLTVLSLITLYFSYSTLKASQFENDIKIDTAQDEANYSYRSQEIINKIPKFPNISTSSQPYIEIAGMYSLKEKKYEEAIKYFNESQKINPYSGRTEWYKYRIYNEQGVLDSAKYYAKKAFEIRPRNSHYYLSAIAVEVNDKDTIAILKTHNQITKYIKDPSIWINTSSALAQSNYSYNGLIQFIDSSLLLFANDTTLLNRKKSFEKNILRTNSKIKSQLSNKKIKPNSLTLAIQYGAESKFDKALKYYKIALLENPNDIIITQNIGICYFKLNQFKSAILYLEKTLNSQVLIDGKTEYLLGASYLLTKNKEKGCQYLKLAENKKYPGAMELVVKYCN